MLALAPRHRTYPVLLPDRPASERAAPRRARRRPVRVAMATVVALALPAVVLVALRTEAARAGYTILSLRHQVETLRVENAQLQASASTLRAPDRIERIATVQLGMITPRSQQVASLPVAAYAGAVAVVPPPTVWDRMAAWFVRSEASAGERSP
ncbi:MAG TPA: cell division protein FtsL [bacterium]